MTLSPSPAPPMVTDPIARRSYPCISTHTSEHAALAPLPTSVQLTCIVIAGPIDYLLWSRALPHPSLPTFTSSWQIIWPELSAMAYNILEGQSANWGIMPRHYYLSNSLPKLLMGSLPLAGAAVAWTTLRQTGLMKRYAQPAAERTVFEVSVRMGLGVGAAGMIAALSCIGHKEWRFVVYVVPVLNVLAAVAAATL